MNQWRTTECSSCAGHGIVSNGTYDFYGPEECVDCGGSGRLFITPSNHVFMYPGGPAKGSWPGRYEKSSSWNGDEE